MEILLRDSSRGALIVKKEAKILILNMAREERQFKR
jgi:hypothetical protein